MSDESVSQKVTIRISSAVYPQLRGVEAYMRIAGIKYRDRAMSLEGVINAIIAHVVSLGEDERNNHVERSLGRLHTLEARQEEAMKRRSDESNGIEKSTVVAGTRVDRPLPVAPIRRVRKTG